MPTGGPQIPQQMGQYADVVNAWNANPNQTLAGYLGTRDQLSKIMAKNYRYGGGSSGGGNYGSSGPSSGGGRLA